MKNELGKRSDDLVLFGMAALALSTVAMVIYRLNVVVGPLHGFVDYM